MTLTPSTLTRVYSVQEPHLAAYICPSTSHPAQSQPFFMLDVTVKDASRALVPGWTVNVAQTPPLRPLSFFDAQLKPVQAQPDGSYNYVTATSGPGLGIARIAVTSPQIGVSVLQLGNQTEGASSAALRFIDPNYSNGSLPAPEVQPGADGVTLKSSPLPAYPAESPVIVVVNNTVPIAVENLFALYQGVWIPKAWLQGQNTAYYVVQPNSVAGVGSAIQPFLFQA